MKKYLLIALAILSVGLASDFAAAGPYVLKQPYHKYHFNKYNEAPYYDAATGYYIYNEPVPTYNYTPSYYPDKGIIMNYGFGIGAGGFHGHRHHHWVPHRHFSIINQ